jgi:Leucine-rich repeat (LRR) protein
MSSILTLPEEIVNLFQLELKDIVQLALICKTLFSLIRNAKHIRTFYKGKWDVGMVGWLNVLWDVDLSHTEVTESISALGKIHTLDLSWTKVTTESISALGNVHALDLEGTQVTDVSALGNVHTLDLSHTKVTDVSALGGVHTLYLFETNVTTDLTILSNVRIYRFL